ncbi:permease [Hyphomicrobium denitrificans 1NES1]|uniref:Permease n=1 Tax=Hyphomicrobium denitrificans 1NES1 TaxID=670307 RepID=N0B8B5_9HYPH|nr:permease [Hyphomicrobium denitrificans]AGK56791.1 permease [Hyphomicrobium denitrificans 1NES1]
MNAIRQQADNTALKVAVFLVLATAGLFYVKWLPYYNRAFVAAAEHSIGNSILMGTAASPPAPSWDAALGYALAYGKAIWQAMVLGLLLGSAIQALLPADWVARVLGKTGFGSVVAAGALSIPSMMCTCCAAPVVVGLRARQASPGAAIAFWLGNTILNPATLVFMGFVLGWNWATLRIVLGVLMVFGLGYLVNLMVTPKEAAEANAELSKFVTNSGVSDSASNPFLRWIEIFVRMSIRLIPEYIVIVLLLGAARAWLFPTIGADIGNEIWWIVAFAVAGTLFVIPTTGEVPIIQAMLLLGIGAGPAGALLMTLPPVSLPSLAMVARSFRPQVLLFVVAAVVAIGIVCGLLAAALNF